MAKSGGSWKKCSVSLLTSLLRPRRRTEELDSARRGVNFQRDENFYPTRFITFLETTGYEYWEADTLTDSLCTIDCIAELLNMPIQIQVVRREK